MCASTQRAGPDGGKMLAHRWDTRVDTLSWYQEGGETRDLQFPSCCCCRSCCLERMGTYVRLVLACFSCGQSTEWEGMSPCTGSTGYCQTGFREAVFTGGVLFPLCLPWGESHSATHLRGEYLISPKETFLSWGMGKECNKNVRIQLT